MLVKLNIFPSLHMPETVELSLIKPLQTSKLNPLRTEECVCTVHFLQVFPDIRKSVDSRKNKINIHFTVYKIEVVSHRGHSVLQGEDAQGNDV